MTATRRPGEVGQLLDGVEHARQRLQSDGQSPVLSEGS